jgi:hypothetical protein
MPNAVAVSTTIRKDLVTLQGAYVELRKLTYGQSLQRQSMVTMRMIQDAESKRKGIQQGEFNLANVDVTAFDFSNCIVDHNLEDETGRKLNLSNPIDFQRLDPRVGQEIDRLISALNQLSEEDEAALGNSEAESAQSS